MKAKKKYNKGGEIDPPKRSNKQLARYLRTLITKKTPMDKIGDIVSSSVNFVANTDDDGWVGIDKYNSKYNKDGSATFDFSKYGDGENNKGLEWFGTPVKTSKMGYEYIDPITIHPLENALELSNKRFKEQKPLQLVDPFPRVYDRKMDASGTKAIYNTSKGEITKKKGKEDADFVKLMKRLGRNYR
tara:strand:- start:31 stop:591 length:561 start_codon:yes stop_codon:yes gene_type:complete